MARVKKTIVRPGVYSVNRPDGKKSMEPITADRLKKWATTANLMISKGVKIPAPYAHYDTNGKAPKPIIVGNDGASLLDPKTKEPIGWRSDLNGGFWEEFTSDENGLHAYIEVPDDQKDKIGKTIQETSIYVEPKYELGDGTSLEDAPMHIALVTHGREMGQPNFESEEEKQAASMAMSFSMADLQVQKEISVEDAIEVLRSLGMQLPDGTNDQNLIERIVIAGGQMASDQQNSDEEDLTTAPIGSAVKPPAVAMSDTTKPSVDKAAALLMGNFINGKRQELITRANRLHETGRVAKAFVEEEIMPAIGAFSMSMDQLNTETGEFPLTQIEQRIADLEATSPLVGPAKMSDQLPPGATAEIDPTPEGPDEDLTMEEMDDVVSHLGMAV